jgi:hypothetical protein
MMFKALVAYEVMPFVDGNLRKACRPQAARPLGPHRRV